MPLPGEDKGYHTKKFMEQTITSLMGGRAAEEIVLKDITTGASNDIERATAIARNMVTRFGMSDKLGPILLGDDNDEVFIGRDLATARNYSEEVAAKIDSEIKRIVETSYQEALDIVNENIGVLHEISELLMKHEKITGDEVRKLFPHGKLSDKRREVGMLVTPKLERGYPSPSSGSDNRDVPTKDEIDRQWRDSSNRGGMDDLKIDWGMHTPADKNKGDKKDK